VSTNPKGINHLNKEVHIMGLTKRKDGWYVEFPVVDDGKVLSLARGTPGSKLKRWKTLTPNKTMAKQQEAKIKTDLMMGKIVSERLKGPMRFKALTTAYLADPKIQRQRIYLKKMNWITKRFLPAFGSPTLLSNITENQIERYLESRRLDEGYQGSKVKPATVNRELAGLKQLFAWAIRKDIWNRTLPNIYGQTKKTMCGMRFLIQGSSRNYKGTPRLT